MISIRHGDLLDADVEALVNPVNTVGVMGKGLALAFKRAHPANFTAYRVACAAGTVCLGHMFVYDSGTPGRHRYVINFPTKGHWRSRSRLADVAAGLPDLVRVLRDNRIASVAVPALGCGHGGLDWAEVRPLVEAALADLPDLQVSLYPPPAARQGASACAK
ncbi:macro domain-containing protein [Micromonospora sp. NPDC047074]|uniref:macro domain-containing protein n=1 Tax=Micromonospora sp. NPDC047074 TaxID=3154339 RepID=UPI0033CEA562